MPIASVNGLDVYYEIHGEGPPLLNISGTGGDLRRMPPALNPLTKSFTVLSYDQRGLGQTRAGAEPTGAERDGADRDRADRDGAEHGPTMADYADDAAGLMSVLGWTSANVVGTSFGGMVALNVAVRHPDVVERLVLCCTSPGGSHPSYPLHQLPADGTDETFATRMRLMDRRWDPAAAEPIPGLGPFYDQFAAEANRTLSAEAADGLGRQLGARAGHDVVDALTSITAPTLVCAGRYDDLAPLENSQVLADRIPGARLEVFEGGHVFMIQDRTAFPTIVEFLQTP